MVGAGAGEVVEDAPLRSMEVVPVGKARVTVVVKVIGTANTVRATAVGVDIVVQWGFSDEYELVAAMKCQIKRSASWLLLSTRSHSRAAAAGGCREKSRVNVKQDGSSSIHLHQNSVAGNKS